MTPRHGTTWTGWGLRDPTALPADMRWSHLPDQALAKVLAQELRSQCMHLVAAAHAYPGIRLDDAQRLTGVPTKGPMGEPNLVVRAARYAVNCGLLDVAGTPGAPPGHLFIRTGGLDHLNNWVSHLTDDERACVNPTGTWAARVAPEDEWSSIVIDRAAHIVGLAERIAEHPDVVDVLGPGLSDVDSILRFSETSPPIRDELAADLTVYLVDGRRIAIRAIEASPINHLPEALRWAEHLRDAPEVSVVFMTGDDPRTWSGKLVEDPLFQRLATPSRDHHADRVLFTSTYAFLQPSAPVETWLQKPFIALDPARTSPETGKAGAWAYLLQATATPGHLHWRARPVPALLQSPRLVCVRNAPPVGTIESTQHDSVSTEASTEDALRDLIAKIRAGEAPENYSKRAAAKHNRLRALTAVAAGQLTPEDVIELARQGAPDLRRITLREVLRAEPGLRTPRKILVQVACAQRLGQKINTERLTIGWLLHPQSARYDDWREARARRRSKRKPWPGYPLVAPPPVQGSEQPGP